MIETKYAQGQMWNVLDAIPVVQLCESHAIKNNYHTAFGGSVLHKGFSNKDLDIFFYPRTGDDDCNEKGLRADLPFTDWKAIALTDGVGFPAKNCKNVWSCKYQGKRIDIFFLKV